MIIFCYQKKLFVRVCVCEKKQTAINLHLFLFSSIVIRTENCIFTAKLSDDDGEVNVEEIMRNLVHEFCEFAMGKIF